MPNAKLGNLDIYYEIHGNGHPLVLIAGYTCDYTFWSGVVPLLSERFQVVVFDNRGSGRTIDEGRAFSIETMADDAAALIGYLSLFKPIVIGQSMGGAIVQAMLLRYAEVCGPCVIMNSTMAFSLTACMALDALLALRKANMDMDLLIDACLPWLFGSQWLSVPANVEAFRKSVIENPFPQSLSDQERQMAAIRQFDATAWNRHLAHRALVISASEDALTTIEEGHSLAQQLGAHFAEVPGGHASPIEQPEHLSRLLLNFFR
jgi:pimeloyl-ACP methyl ester carboxylesterase